MSEQLNPVCDHVEKETRALDMSGLSVKSCSSSSPNEKDAVDLKHCVVCKSSEVAFTNFPCKCCRFCKKCAMKLATGGKCKSCHEIFTSMSAVHST